MPKLKSHKSSLKRIKITANGKVLVHPTGGSHLMSGKSSKKRRHIRRARPVRGLDRVRSLKAQNMSALPKKAPAPSAPSQTAKPEGA